MANNENQKQGWFKAATAAVAKHFKPKAPVDYKTFARELEARDRQDKRDLDNYRQQDIAMQFGHENKLRNRELSLDYGCVLNGNERTAYNLPVNRGTEPNRPADRVQNGSNNSIDAN